MLRLLIICAAITTASSIAVAQSTSFSYQGVLKEGGSPASGTFHLRFQLWDSPTGGSQIGADHDVPALTVDDGLFTTALNFGASAFNGSDRWLQVQVITNGGSTITNLVPRQAISPSPYALYALTADGPNLTNLNASNLASGTVPNAQLGGTYGNAVSFSNIGNSFAGAFIGDGEAVTNLSAANIASGTLSAARLPTSGAWPLTGTLNIDSNTLAIDPVNNRVGIGTNAPLTPLHVVGDAAALRLQDDDDPNSYGLLEDWQPGILRLMKFNGLSGSTLIDFDPMPSDPTGGGIIRVFRATNTTGLKAMQFYRGNGANEAHAAIAVDGANSYFQLGGGNVGIGTATPVGALHVRKTGPFMVLQDNASNANQAGYLGFWNSSGTETGWMGYGTPGSPHMSIFNGRAGGNIALLPTANVGIGTTAPLAKLDVRGDIRMGPTGAQRVASGPESLRLVRGIINATGSIGAGSGFTVTRTALGRYLVTFTPSFSAVPAVTATPTNPTRVQWTNLNSSSVELWVFNVNGLFVDDTFCMIAIGPN